MRFEDLNWMDIETYLKSDDRLMLVIGACEQHGYLSLTTDVKIPLALADAVSQKSGVLVAPTINYGCSPYFQSYPGTISTRINTLLNLLEDIITSIYHSGFRRVLVLNGHGGNSFVRTFLYEMANRYPEMKFGWYEWWKSPAVEGISRKYDLKPTHANWLEAFSFTIVSNLPDKPKPEIEESAIVHKDKIKNLYGDGSFGGNYFVSPHIMDEMFNACIDELLDLLNFTTTL
ncbi:MAG: creatininase family protein [Anaerolineales bacterium]